MFIAMVLNSFTAIFPMDENFSFIEIQGTSEKRPFTNQELNGMLDLARKGISKLFEYQEKVIG